MAKRPARSGRAVGTGLAAIATLLASCATTSTVGSPATSSDPHRGTSPTPGSTGTSSTSTTTTTLPPSFGVGVVEYPWVRQGASEDYTPVSTTYRPLSTYVFYPSTSQGAGGSGATPAADAPMASVGAPFPVIVFAHGYDQTPDSYQALIDAWVEAGFVVAAPVFPGESRDNVNALGGWNTDAGFGAQSDVANEPGDIAYVVGQLTALASTGASPFLGKLDMSRLALAGQSDGAAAVAALVYAQADQSIYSAMADRPLAVAVLSGSELESAGTYGTPVGAPAELSVQSTSDYCNHPSKATVLYDAIGGEKWWLTIDGAPHLAPYTGIAPYAQPIEELTSAFFELVLGWRSASAARADMRSAGNSPGVTSLSDSSVAPAIPDPPESGDPGGAAACGLSDPG